MRIGLAYNEKPDPASTEQPESPSDAFVEWDDPSTIAAVEQALGPFGSVIRLEADQLFPQELALARALAPQGPHQGDTRLSRCPDGTLRLRRGAARPGAGGAAVPGVREARGRGVGQGGVREQRVSRSASAAQARAVPARPLCRARAGRDVSAGARVHRRDSG